ncbi:MAG: KH domain-containing protein [Pseudomonadota bacterium]|nr:KH domain-containing protein [Pseudomonadota bacterium]
MEVKALVEAIVRALVDYPDQVFVTEVEGTNSCVLELSVAAEDVGKVIGKKGIHADAIRRIVHAIGGKNKKRYVLEILEHPGAPAASGRAPAASG